MQAHRLRIDVPEDHRLTLDLPESFPAGPAEVIVLTAAREGRKIVRAGGVLTLHGPEPGGDPIGETLADLRRERAARIDRSVTELDRDET